MTDTKAVANLLPNLDIEIRHRHHPMEGAEYLAITLRATPSFEAAGLYLDAWTQLLVNPMAGWVSAMQMAQAFWQPWLGPSPRWLPADGETSAPRREP